MTTRPHMRKTRWERECDGCSWKRTQAALRWHDQRDIDCLSLQIRRESKTVVDDSGVIRGEVASAIVEARKWERV